LVNGQLKARVDNGQAIPATTASLAKAFRDIWDYVGHASRAVYPAAESTGECRFSDQRTMQVGGVPVKPDGVFYYPMYLGSELHSVHAFLEAQLEPNLDATPPDVLGKMADLAVNAWEAQPTRTFVPFFYMHGPDISLVLFARSGYYCTTIGRLFYTSSDPSTDDICNVRDTLRYLWFLLTLPSDRFGHFVDVSVPATGLNLKMFGGTDSTLDFLQRIPLSVSLLDFQSYVFKTQYRRRPAMLKLVWTPTYRLPEAFMYTWLLKHDVTAVPRVYESTIIADNIFGYRLEYLVIEDCGVPLLQYFKDTHGNTSDTGNRDADGEGIFKQLASCLALAHSAGVIHCDVSAENIAVRDGNAFIFDWTRTQLTTSEVQARLEKALRGIWKLDARDLQPLRWPGDSPVVQTPIYASIRSLWLDITDSLLDRFESLFYIIMHALYHSNHTQVGAPSAFEELSVSAMALIKTGCLADPDMYPKYFGIAEVGDSLKTFLDAVRLFLFCPDGIFIGGKLVDGEFERSVRPELAKSFLCMTAFAVVFPEADCTASSGTSHAAAKPPFSLMFSSSANFFTAPAVPSTTLSVSAPAPAPPVASTSATTAPAATASVTPAPTVPVTAPAATVPATAPAAPISATAALVPTAPTLTTKAPVAAPASAAPTKAAPISATAALVPTAPKLTTKAPVAAPASAAPAPVVPAVTATTAPAAAKPAPNSGTTATAAPTATTSSSAALATPDWKELAKCARDSLKNAQAAKASASVASTSASAPVAPIAAASSSTSAAIKPRRYSVPKSKPKPRATIPTAKAATDFRFSFGQASENLATNTLTFGAKTATDNASATKDSHPKPKSATIAAPEAAATTSASAAANHVDVVSGITVSGPSSAPAVPALVTSAPASASVSAPTSVPAPVSVPASIPA
ncbi:hypothetical protein H4S07_003159, partial [Coemansia furcata]